jgi:hypothetical protein
MEIGSELTDNYVQELNEYYRSNTWSVLIMTLWCIRGFTEVIMIMYIMCYFTDIDMDIIDMRAYKLTCFAYIVHFIGIHYILSFLSNVYVYERRIVYRVDRRVKPLVARMIIGSMKLCTFYPHTIWANVVTVPVMTGVLYAGITSSVIESFFIGVYVPSGKNDIIILLLGIGINALTGTIKTFYHLVFDTGKDIFSIRTVTERMTNKHSGKDMPQEEGGGGMYGDYEPPYMYGPPRTRSLSV